MTELSARDLSCSDQLKPCWSFPGLPLGRMLRMLAGPKLIRRTNGVLGAVLEYMSSSSIALSSMESELFELVDTLPRRTKEDVFVGELPERPRVVTERRRRPVSMGPED